MVPVVLGCASRFDILLEDVARGDAARGTAVGTARNPFRVD
jgi:hypothetical protein